MQYIEIFLEAKIENRIRKKMLFLLLKFGQAVLTFTHNLFFGPEIRKMCIPLHTTVVQDNSGVQEGIHCTDVFS